MPDETAQREFSSWLDAHDAVLTPGITVVELGCGLGADAAFMSGLGLRVFAMDRSPKRVAEAARRAPGVRLIVGDMTAGLPFRTGVADLVVASLSLHYFDLATTQAILRDVSRVLRSDGILLCRVNVVGEKIARWGEGIEHEQDFFEVEPGLFKRFFSEQSLCELLSGEFEVELVRMEQTVMIDGEGKRTLVARARRRQH